MSANSSKANDPRFWSLWKRSGSVVHNINVPEPTGGTHIKEYGDTLVEIFKSCYSNNFWRKKGQIQIEEASMALSYALSENLPPCPLCLTTMSNVVGSTSSTRNPLLGNLSTCVELINEHEKNVFHCGRINIMTIWSLTLN